VPDLLQWGLDLIIAIQRFHGPALDGIFRAFSFMGEEEFYLFLLPFLFWCVDFGLGARLAILFLLSSYLNADLKDLFHEPRPFDMMPSVQLSSAEGHGLPSGHAQSSVVVWGSIAAWVRKRRFWVATVVLAVLIGFSRIYLGVHFPTDVLAGWAIGGGLLVLYLAMQSWTERKLEGLSLGFQVLVGVAVPIVLFLVHPVKDTANTLGALAGLGVGLALARRHISFSTGGPRREHIVRFILGGAIALALYLGLKAVFPGEGSAFYLAFRFLRYGLVGAWVSLGAPWTFRRVGLAAEAERHIWF